MFKKKYVFFAFLITTLIPLAYVFSSELMDEGIKQEEGLKRLEEIHSKLKLIHGRFLEEYPEQLMVATYLPADAKVLELGSEVGRNSCVIGAILNDSRNLVTLETRPEAVKSLRENRDFNKLQFHIVHAALSKVPIIQKGWISIPSEVDLPGYFRINTFTFNELQEKYKIEFDTMVVDCEGALYYILCDDPEILKNIKLVIIENDFKNQDHYRYVKNLFIKNGLEVVYNGSERRYWENGFYQVWKKGK